MTATDVRVADAAPAPGAPRPRSRRTYDPAKRRSTLLTVLLALCALYFLFPFVWLVIASTKDNEDLFSTFGLWFGHHFSLVENVRTVFTAQGGIFLRWMGNTILYAGVSALGAAALATMAGYAFARYQFFGSKILFSTVLGAVMVPLTALAIPTYLLFSNAGLTDTPLAIILPSLVSPFGVFLIRVYAADAVPESLIEAARVDGAGELRIFWQVSLRLLGPAVLTVFLFALVATWNNYFLPLIMLSSSELYPITVGLAQWQSTSTTGGGGSQALFSTVITGALVSILPLVVAFLYLQRYWQTGLATGSVKE
ncbi:carbohydrate ABC transporter permease [Microlunatus spumicola]|uniref:Carbohydrate ABC transporter permease n=1 Tax=Microlunatus spumicola TaxID=81499 RepID=A0ABP6WXS5_9ACTN